MSKLGKKLKRKYAKLDLQFRKEDIRRMRLENAHLERELGKQIIGFQASTPSDVKTRTDAE